MLHTVSRKAVAVLIVESDTLLLAAAFLQRREKEMRSSNLRPDTEEYGTEDVNDLSHFEILKKYQRCATAAYSKQLNCRSITY